MIRCKKMEGGGGGREGEDMVRGLTRGWETGRDKRKRLKGLEKRNRPPIPFMSTIQLLF